jgi:mono/diheme cytochrome c family protein
MFRRRIRRNHFTGRRTGGKLSGHAKVEQETTVPMTRHKRGRDTARFLLRHKLLFGVLGATALLLVGMLAGVAILLSGAFSTAATTQHTAFTHWLLDTGLRYSLAAGADGIEVPELSDASMIERGRTCFRAHCVHCHGAPALARAPHGLGMMPIPNDLTESSRDWPAAWLYYVTAKGVRMTGMPAWEFRLSDEDLWSTVAFLRTLPELSHAEYRELDPLPARANCVSDASAIARRAETDDREERGRIVLRQYACHACHRIDGVVGPEARVGPPLADWPQRRYIAGTLPNTPDNLVRWIVDPAGVSPGTLMPDLGVTEAHAREMAAFLFAQE